ncbi:MAG: SDR family oxidoreductase [Chloroflexi bacterium]|nr:SDR family oxidoreductase [Chloroflexota bacterium]
MAESGQGVVIVTGSTVGIGRAIAGEFAAAGWSVVVNARNADDVATVSAELAAKGGTVLGIPTDVTDPDAVRAMVERTEAELGPIDVLVNNAGIPGPVAFAQNVEPHEFLEVLRINLWGAFLCSKYVIPGMIERGAGRIINMTGGGAATDRPLRGGIAYASSKAGVEGMTRNLALELSRFGVTVNAIQPGRIASRGFPELEGDARRGVQFVSAEPAGRLALWLASDEAAEVTGETIDAQAWDAERREA